MIAHTRLQKHNRRVKEYSEKDKITNGVALKRNALDMPENSEAFKDQGYTRPKVLLLCPTRGVALVYLKKLFGAAGNLAYIDGYDRFLDDYSVNRDEAKTDADHKERVLMSKSKDWQDLFGEEVNDDDDFKLGISVVNSRKKDMGKKFGFKLYTDFMKSDIIVASPLALKMHIERDDNADFLSSIEICNVIYSDALLMQNWDHVTSVLGRINQQPKNLNDTDFSRVRKYCLDGHAKYWRQLIMISPFKDPSFLASFRRHACSLEGRTQINSKVGISEASICDVDVKVKQVFQRVLCQSISNQKEEKLNYFRDRVLPQLLKLKQKHTLIYIPSYFDFVAVRNLLMNKEANFVSVTEYARVSEVSRGRSRFQQGRKHIMLYTGRCHFFKRHKIKGIRHIIFYGLPEHSMFYSEMINVLNNIGKTDIDVDLESPNSCLSIFTKYDSHSLERIVGTSHCEHMIRSTKCTFLFNS